MGGADSRDRPCPFCRGTGVGGMRSFRCYPETVGTIAWAMAFLIVVAFLLYGTFRVSAF